MFRILQLVVFTFLYHQSSCQTTSFMTYNIKNDYQKEGDNNWNSRRSSMVELLQYYEPDVFGVQEALLNQLEDLDSGLANFSYIGLGREDGKTKGEYAAIFYNRKAYAVLHEGTFWLSETPTKISKGWDAAYERICTYGLLEHQLSKKRVWVFNAHFDHMGIEARINSAKLIVEKIAEINASNYPLILMGDFNAEESEETIQVLLSNHKDGQKDCLKPFYGPFGTFNGFTEDIMTKRIDYIFYDKFNILSYTHIDDRMDNYLQVSDHVPVMMLCTFD